MDLFVCVAMRPENQRLKELQEYFEEKIDEM